MKQIRSSAWLEHYTDNVGVSSSNLLGSTMVTEALVKVIQKSLSPPSLKLWRTMGG
jgi:hypothetical protein